MSFRKKNAEQQLKLPPGSRLSAYNGQLLISTGVPSLDDILGGGLPVGTVLLIKEDRATSYAQLLLKYFIAQGIASGHHCALASRDQDVGALMQSLMWLATSDIDDDDQDVGGQKAKSQADSDRLKIAWRYAHLSKFETSVRTKAAPQPAQEQKTPSASSPSQQPTGDEPRPYCSAFDLTKSIPSSVLDTAQKTLFDSPDEEGTDDYAKLFDDICRLVVDKHFSSAVPVPPNTQRNILRLAIHSLASPSWQSKTPHDLYKFFHSLRGLLRFSFGVAVVTLPAYLYDEAPNYIQRIEHMVDAVIKIESFAGSEVHNGASYTQNYHGFFYIEKLPVLNSLLPPSTKLSVLSAGGSNDLAFKLRRKRFTIETFHLPPEGGVNERKTEPPSTTGKKTKRIGCASSGSQDPLAF